MQKDIAPFLKSPEVLRMPEFPPYPQRFVLTQKTFQLSVLFKKTSISEQAHFSFTNGFRAQKLAGTVEQWSQDGVCL